MPLHNINIATDGLQVGSNQISTFANSVYLSNTFVNGVVNMQSAVIANLAITDVTSLNWLTASNYVYDAVLGSRFYWTKLADAVSEGNALIEYHAKEDANYPDGVKGTIFFSRYTSTTISVQHDQQSSDPFGVQVAIDNNGAIWLRIPDCQWNHFLRWRFIHVTGGISITTTTTQQETQPDNSIIILGGQRVRATYGNVTASAASAASTSNFGSGLFRGSLAVTTTITSESLNVSNTLTSGSLGVTTTLTSNTTQSNSIGVGTAPSATIGEIRATDNIIAYYTSDLKFKQNIKPIDDALSKVVAIGGKYFDWSNEYIEARGGEDGYFIQKHDIGVVAQDVEKVFPEAVRKKADGSLAVDYPKLCVLAFQAIAELKEELDNIKGK